MGAKLNFNFLFDYESPVNDSVVVSCTSIPSQSLGQKQKLKEPCCSKETSPLRFYRKTLLYVSTAQNHNKLTHSMKALHFSLYLSLCACTMLPHPPVLPLPFISPPCLAPSPSLFITIYNYFMLDFMKVFSQIIHTLWGKEENLAKCQVLY